MNVNNTETISHCWRVYLKSGSIIDISREIFCKPITESEAMEVASEKGEILKLEAISLNESDFWD